jgi:hypothetical protein
MLQTRASRTVIQVIRLTASVTALARSATLDTSDRRVRHTRALRTAIAQFKQTASVTRHAASATLASLAAYALDVRGHAFFLSSHLQNP